MMAQHQRTRDRAAVTLAEILVATALTTVVIGGAMMIYHLSARSRGVTAAAQGLSTAMIIEETITADLRRLIQVAPAPVRFGPDGSRLAFFACDPASAQGPVLGVRGVRYSIAAKGGLLEREWAGEVHAVGSSPLTSLAFLPFRSPTGPMVRVNLEVGRTPGEPDGPPVIHSFLAPIASARRRENLQLKLLSKFQSEADLPGEQELPAPAPIGGAPPLPPVPEPGTGTGPAGPDESPVPAPSEAPPPRPAPSPGR